ncbi:MAG: aspartate aminotransferase family protein, partial [Cyanobacteriota bacterium]
QTLKLLKQPGTYERLEAITQRLSAGLMAAARGAGVPICGGSVSAMFGFFLCPGPVRNFAEAKATDTARFAKLHRAMLERGVYLAPSAFEAGFTSLAHSDADVDATISAFAEAFALIA